MGGEPMGQQVDTDVNRWAVEAAIRAVLHRYAYALDRQDMAMITSCFTEDVTAEYSGHDLGRGVENILRLLRGAGAYEQRMHHVGTIVVTAMTEDTAEAESYTLAYLLGRDSGGELYLITRGVHYYDAFRRAGSEWRIFRRKHSVEWST